VRSSQSRRLGLALIAATVAALIRLAPLTFVVGTDRMMDPIGDSQGYVELARALRYGCGFTRMVDGKCGPLPGFFRVIQGERSFDVSLFPDIIRTPGYPLFLSLMPNLSTALIAQALLSGLMVFAVCTFILTRWRSEAALISSALIAFDIPSIVYSNQIMSETLFAVLFVLGVISALHTVCGTCNASRIVALLTLASTLFGAATIVRPVGEFALGVPAVIPFMFAEASWVKRIGLVALVILVPALVVGGWSLRNYRVTGVAYFSPVGASDLYYFGAVPILTYATHGRSGVKLSPGPTDVSSQALRIIAHHPMVFAQMTSWNFLFLSFAPVDAQLQHLLGSRRSFPLRPSGSSRARAALSAFVASPSNTFHSIYQTEFDASPTIAGLIVLQLLMSLILWLGVIAALRLLSLRSYTGTCVVFCLATPLMLLLLASGIPTPRQRIAALPLLAIVSGIGWVDACARMR
jgi:4-amino-4-deoxy-L-arabinose transferase-like glycosyltransferase